MAVDSVMTTVIWDRPCRSVCFCIHEQGFRTKRPWPGRGAKTRAPPYPIPRSGPSTGSTGVQGRTVSGHPGYRQRPGDLVANPLLTQGNRLSILPCPAALSPDRSRGGVKVPTGGKGASPKPASARGHRPSPLSPSAVRSASWSRGQQIWCDSRADGDSPDKRERDGFPCLRGGTPMRRLHAGTGPRSP